MTHAPASGERAALRGYRWQYDHIASRVYDALLDGDFRAVRLADPDAGRVDDLALIKHDRTDGYQFKSVGHDSYLTFQRLVGLQRTRGGANAPSLIRSLAEGWTRLRERWGNTQVHLVTKQLASINDHLGDAENRPSPDHFSAFLATVLEPLRCDGTTLDEAPPGWQEALRRLREASGVAHEEIEQFLRALHLDVAAGSGLPHRPSIRHADITALSIALQRRVAEAHGVVELDERELLALVGWENRPRLHSRHEFPVDLDTYQPLTDAAEQLKASIARHDSGYVAVIGPPGAGKSTLLSQALTGGTDRVLRYYAYVPGSAPARTRRTAQAFLHDLVVMLNADGSTTRDRELPGNDIPGLRQQVADQLDAASAEFGQTRRRTILVVDGLDHVDRDHAGNDGLLAEMPTPDELPDGVLIVIGSRTLAPLHAHGRQQVEERSSVIDLQHHRLSRASILEICRRVPPASALSPDIHQRIVHLCNGHPLAMSYLLNRLREADTGSAHEVLDAAPAYAGDMAAEYRAVWDDIEDDDAVVDILAVCARLRIAFTTEWLSTWAQPSAVRAFRRKLLYLFRRYRDGWRFFHDSFRQFAADRTALGDDGRPDECANARAHQRVARLCTEACDPRVSAEALYHRYCAEQRDEVLALARPAVLRAQFRQLRSPALIREDISLAMKVAADRGDVLTTVRLLLSMVDADERISALEDVDMPGALYDAGLIDEAIAWCGEDTRRVPLPHAYRLAARLGAAGDPAGRRLFDLVEHDVDGPDRVQMGGEEDEKSFAWTRAAAFFRPLPAVIAAIRNQIERCTGDDSLHAQIQAERWSRYAEMYQVLIDVQERNETALNTIDSALADDSVRLVECTLPPEGGDGAVHVARARRSPLASISDLRVQVRVTLLEGASTAEEAKVHLDCLLSIANDAPMFPSAILDIAERLVLHNLPEPAAALLDRTSYDESLTVQDLGYDGAVDAIEQRFRYWRLRFLLASDDDDVPAPIPPESHTPAGNAISPTAAVHCDTDAIELAARIDTTVRALAKLDARTVSDCPAPLSEAWATLVPLLDVFSSKSEEGSATLRGITRRKRELMDIVATVAGRYGRGLPQWLGDMLAQRFKSEPDRWPLYLRLELADRLRSTGAISWHGETLDAYEAAVATQDVHSRLRETSDLIRLRARDGDMQTAQRLVRAMLPMAFGIGYRKDYQLTSWVAWLARALREPEGGQLLGDSAWLARILTATDSMTEGAPRSAAIDLPVAVISVAPLAAVRIFEYLVRHGAVDHLDALAALVRANVDLLDAEAASGVDLAADIAAELLARAGRHAYPELARSIRAKAERACSPGHARTLAVAIADRTDMYALPTTRGDWRRALGLATDTEEHEGSDDTVSPEHEHNVLVLSDGQELPHGAVVSRAHIVDDIIALRRNEALESRFSWTPIVEHWALSSEDVRALVNVFDDDTHRDLEVLALLAEFAERNGDQETALRLSSRLLRSADRYSWTRYFGGVRVRAAAIAVRLSGHDGRVDACRDLAHHVTVNPGLASLLRSELDSIVRALDSSIGATVIWPEIRAYLEGIAETLSLPDPDVLTDHGCRWWLLSQSADQRAECDNPTIGAALAELAVGYLSHPASLVREAATRIVTRALLAANEEVAKALGRFAQPDASDDTLEAAGRCLAAARVHDGFIVSDCLRPLEDLLASHPSQVMRDLAPDPSPTIHRALSPLYDMAFPPDSSEAIGAGSVTLAPYRDQYEKLAEYLGLNLDTLLAIAARYASEAMSLLPDDTAVREAFRRSHMQYLYLLSPYIASRAAFGRVLGDLADAILLDDLPRRLYRLLRTVDIDALNRVPERRPATVPTPPEAGHDQTIARWRAEIEDRLEAYIAQSTRDERMLIGARSRLTVLNWNHLKEALICGTTVGTDTPINGRILAPVHSMLFRELGGTAPRRRPDDGEALVVENDATEFFQHAANWLSLRPDLAATLEWTPDPARPGRWHTSSGDLAAETIWWVDGWWGRNDRAFDDTVAEGHAVVVTLQGLREMTNAFGSLTRHFMLTRRGKDDGRESAPESATRSIGVVLPCE